MIERVTTDKEINDYLMSEIRKRERVVINVLHRVGEGCVNHARSIPMDVGFQDQTGNLRSSIGYAIVKDGVVLSMSDFGVVRDGSQGQKGGKRFIDELARGMKGLQLVVVAGMRYALYLEANHNRDVLKSAELIAQREVPRLLKEIGFKV